ncbi:acetate uptake transporter [Methanolobus sp. WCC1]|jgi:hypothetical protein|uniref:Putative membrane protein n=1 Tax=Methanolobus tindarius DSM 2278 TaxID=1090322 RepID=W9DS27_METTI|nr:GPR1/FUN34/YaaH family transporter [Methanolobus tindarius]ETA68568.1 putative membrane protein [Methanolobus tindarius DSM 2278]
MEGEVTIKDSSAASPAAVGFFGLGFAATFAGLLNMGVIPDGLMVIAMAITLGGVAEVIAGWQLWKKGDTFGASAFTIFGLWWFAFSYINLAPVGIFNAPMEAASAISMGLFTLVWGLIATALTVATLKIGLKMLTVVFVVLDLTFFSLALVFLIGFSLTISGLITLITGIVALYIGVALVYGEVGIKLPL